MEFEDEAFVLSARAYGESGAIVDLLTSSHGRRAAHVAGGASRRLKPILQAGGRVNVRYRSRTSEQLGSATIEAADAGPSALFDDPAALSGLSAAAAVAAGALPEREAHPGAFLAMEALTAALPIEGVWPAVYVRFESGLLEELGFGLDLSRCAATGTTEELIYVSPRTGRAVSREAGEPYKDRLLPLPRFMLSSQGGLEAGDVGQGLDITGHFLELYVFGPLNRPLPPARVWLLDRLRETQRL
jgi:DNA repair protein RecO (recombination protein O)